MAQGQWQEVPVLSLPQSGGFAPYLRVILSGGTLALAGPTDREIGTIAQPVPASGVGSSTVAPVLTPSSEGSAYFVASGAIPLYGLVYGDVNGMVTNTPNGNLIGIALSAATASGDWLGVQRLSAMPRWLYASLAASAVLTNTVTETDFGLDFTVPANLLKAGDILDIHASGFVVGVTSTPNLTVKLYLGTQVLVSTGAVAVLANGQFILDAKVVVQTGGSGGTQGTTGYTTIGVPGTAVPTPFRLATTTALNTTIANLIKTTGTWSAAAAGNQAILDTLTVQRLAS